jgi:hypothetical protein
MELDPHLRDPKTFRIASKQSFTMHSRESSPINLFEPVNELSYDPQ